MAKPKRNRPTKQQTEKMKADARQKYVVDRMSADDIADLLGIDRTTVFRWKKAGMWDEDVKSRLQSGAAIQGDAMDAVRTLINEFAQSKDPATADAAAKIFKIAKSLDSSIDMLANILTFSDEFVSFCGEYYPQVRPVIAEPMERFLARMREKYA